MSVATISAVRAKLNFAVEAGGGGAFANNLELASKTRQNLHPFEAEIRDARALDRPASLAREGFVIASHRVVDPDFQNEEWLTKVYVPSCVELVKRVTGAREAIPYYTPIFRTAGAREGKTSEAFPPATFAHIDTPRTESIAYARKVAAMHGKTFERGALLNVWKAISPPPQDMPLALCDQRTIFEKDFAIGMTVTPEGESPHIELIHSPEQQWYYFPDMRLDETIIFMGQNFDPATPLGAAHTAFKHPDVSLDAAPRMSMEVRFIAIFE